jgi:hypothetical protein
MEACDGNVGQLSLETIPQFGTGIYLRLRDCFKVFDALGGENIVPFQVGWQECPGGGERLFVSEGTVRGYGRRS